ncbi:MAG: hypothetical protein OEU09_22860 [Rhodospirillales bacterium]|nr:hypothetical protein [Rhodospirillales bacterium]MDH3914129.1 hypothetical protein [Rhodospirillales bacterium]MDH3916577.1 hypothetical protein [Rhodospirillales bacterium]
MSKTWTVAALAAALMLAACAALPTPYQPAADPFSYGYSDEQIDAETWRVSFAGNSITARGTVEDYLHYRAAEITLAAGAEGFVVVKEDIEKDVTYHGVGYPAGGYISHGYGRGYYSGFGVGYGTSTLSPTNSYTGYATIRVFNQTAPAGLGTAYDANAVLRVLGPKIVRPMPEAG